MGLFKRSKKEPLDLPEVDESLTKEEPRTVNVAVENLKTISDADRIQGMLREGKVVFLRIKDMRTKDITELKRTVERLKKTVVASDGDIVGIEEDVLVLCPPNVRVHRG